MKTKLFLLMSLAAAFVVTGCSSDDVVTENNTEKKESGNKVTIVCDTPGGNISSRSTDATVNFLGGKATGGGYYNSIDRPDVTAIPDENYTIDYFYGGPTSGNTKLYDYAATGKSSFNINMADGDHQFHVGFKKQQFTLTVVAETGGTATGSGTFDVKTPTPITATPASGYTFAGWEVTSGDCTIANASSASTTVTLNSTNGTVKAKYTISEYIINVTGNMNGNGKCYIQIDRSVPFVINFNYDIEGYDDNQEGTSPKYTCTNSFSIPAGSTLSNSEWLSYPTFENNNEKYYTVLGNKYNSLPFSVIYNGVQYKFQ